jgi:hypothetical protein
MVRTLPLPGFRCSARRSTKSSQPRPLIGMPFPGQNRPIHADLRDSVNWLTLD